MPIAALGHVDIRRFCIDAHMRGVQKHRMNVIAEDRLATAPVREAASEEHPNEPVEIQDIVHYICDNLSPAGSFIVCTGSEKPGNYGERLIQREKKGAGPQARKADFATKEAGLTSYFSRFPGCYEFKYTRNDEFGRPCHTVKFREVLLESDDEEG